MFFKTLSEMIEGYDLSITVRKTDDQVVCTVLPKPHTQDPALKNLSPIIFKGTPEEVDAEFFDKLGSPLEKVRGLVTSANEFEEELKAREADTKREKDRKEKEAKVKKTFTDTMKEWDTTLANKDHKACQEMLNKASKIADLTDELKEQVKKKQAELNVSRGNVSLFDNPTTA